MERICFLLMLYPLSLISCISLTAPDAWIDDEHAWNYEKVPRPPRDHLEELAVTMAERMTTLEEGNVIAAFIGHEQGCRLVAIVEGLAEDGADAASKKVMRYRIASGKILASAGPAVEPFPDVEFEKAIMIAAQKAVWGGRSVVPYAAAHGNFTLRGIKEGPCSARVQVMNGFSVRSEELFEKTVNMCTSH